MNRIIQDDARSIADADLPWDGLNGKTVLISGANGYVPAYFVHTFMSRNDLYGANMKVIALCRNRERAKARFADYLGRNDFMPLIQDVCDPVRIAEPVYCVIHAASPAGIRARHAEPVSTFAANVLGCRNMLDLAVRNQSGRFLLVSSVDIYGDMNSRERIKESDIGELDSLAPRNAYSCAKRAAETLCACYHSQYGVPAVIARPFQIVAPGIALDDGRLHADFISQMLASRQIVLKGDGSAKRTFMYGTDAVSGLLTAMFRGVPGEAYNVVDENGEATVLELATLMASLVSDREVKVVFDYGKRDAPEVKNAVPCVTGSSEKLRALGWRPQLALREFCRRTMEYYGLRTDGQMATKGL